MKNVFYIIIIVIVSYLLLIFISPSLADNIGNSLGIKDINKEVRDFKSSLDFFSTDDKKIKGIENTANNLSETGKVTDLQGGIIEARDIITNKIDETKTDIDATRKAVDETNKNIQKTQESINATLDSINQVQDGLKNVAQ